MRAIATNRLKDLPPFRNVSLRLIADLVELAGANVKQLQVGAEAPTEAVFIVVLDGALQVGPPPRAAAYPAAAEAVRRTARLTAGDVYWGGDPEVEDRFGVLTTTDPGGALYLELTSALLRRALDASATFAETFRPGASTYLSVGNPAAHLIWVGAQPQLQSATPLEALTQLLAASVARQFDEATAIVTFDAPAVSISMWANGQFGAPFPFTVSPFGEADIVAALAQKQPEPFYHVFFVRPSNPNVIPAAFTDSFDRIVYLATTRPTEVPPALAGRLNPNAQNASDPSAPYFSSFISSLLLPPAKPSRSAYETPPRSLFLPPVLRCSSGFAPGPKHFRSEPLDDDFPPATPDARLQRDSCRLRFDLAELQHLWTTSQATQTSFVDAAFAANPAHEQTAFRWARAVTNRQVGLALSGGGASSYRLVPFIRFLLDQNVPIDVVSSISGGSVLAAYYCKDGRAGLQTYVKRGRVYKGLFYASLVSSVAVETVVDWDFRGTELDEVEVRFVPLTTALPPDGPPQASAIVGGTLGEAVRASGAAPGLLGPTEKRHVRYTDGVTATPVPARAVSSYGADLVFACNSIAGPDRRNPFDGSLWGQLAYMTPLGRLIDLWVGGAFLIERVSEQASEDADVPVEVSPEEYPLIECFQFERAEEIVEDSEMDPKVQNGATACAQRWRDFAGT